MAESKKSADHSIDSEVDDIVNIENHYKIDKVGEQAVPRFHMTGQSFEVGFLDMDKFKGYIGDLVQGMFGAVIQKSFMECDTPRDRVGVEIKAPALETPILIPFSSREQLTAGRIIGAVEKVQQSKQSMRFDETMTVTVTRITPPEDLFRT